MHTRLLALAAATAVVSFSLSVSADDESTTLERVVVSATRSEMPVDRLPATAIVIDRTTLDRYTGASLAELLRFHAGLDIARNGGPGAATSLFIRGTESNHVLVLIDGVEMNPGSIGGAAFQHIPLESIERVEIIKGPRSALYGSEAIGGVINITTRRGDADQWHASATAGSFGTQELDAAYLGRSGNAHFGAQLGRHESDGFPPLAASDIDRGYMRDQLNLHAGWRNEMVFAELRHWRAEGVSEYLDFFLAPLSQEFSNETSSIDLRMARDAWSGRLLLGNGKDAIHQREENFLGERDYMETDRTTADAKFDYHLATRTLSVGTYLEDTDVVARSFGSGYASSEDVKAVYVQDVSAFGKNDFVTALRYSDYENFGGEFTWNFGWNHMLDGGNRLFASAGTAFRAPDATDRFGFGGNEELEPETSTSIELGYSHALTPQQALDVTLFRTDIDNLIAYVDPDGFMGPLPGRNENIDEVRIEGLELRHEWQAERWQWRLEAILQDPRDVASGTQLARRAKRTITASYIRELGNFQLGIDALASSSRPDSPFNDDTLAGYGVLSANARWFLSPNWSMNLRIENLGDRAYQTAGGYNSAERGYYLSVRYAQ